MMQVTKKDIFKAMANYFQQNHEIAFNGFSAEQFTETLENEIEKLKRASVKRREMPSKKAEKNGELAMVVANNMESGKHYTINELQELIPEIANLSVQKVSAILKEGANIGIITRETDKKKIYWRLTD